MIMSACAASAGARCPRAVYGATVGFTARDPNVFAVSRRISREALGQDALKLRFVGRAELQVMVIVQLARDGWPVV
jgi:hypothetical protein